MRSSLPILLLVVALAAGLGLRAWLPGKPADDGTAAGAAIAAAQPAGVPQGHVYAGVTEQPDDVNPLTAHGLAAQRILSHTHDTLLDSDPATGELRPALASAWQPAADGASCLFTLRQGVQFADGTPLTLDDVLFAWQVARAGALPLGFAGIAFERVADVEVIDERRFQVRFRDAHFAAVRAVGEHWPVVSRRWFVARVDELAQRAGVAPPAVGTPDFALLLGRIDDECGPGTGPYVLHNAADGQSGWRRGHELTLVRNEHCWRRAAHPGTWNFAGIRYLFLDPAAAFNALLRGELDWYSSPAIDEILGARPELAERFRRVEYDYRQLGVYGIVWNCRRPPFDDARVRRALAMLLDLQQVRQVFGGHGVPARAFAKPDSPDYPRQIEALPCDLPRARAELRAAGHGTEVERPLRLVLLAPEGPEPIRRTLDLFADAARQVGIDLDVRVREWSVFVAEKQQDAWDGLFVHQGFRPWGDPYDFVHSGSEENAGHWSHPDADRLATAARAEFDPQRRAALWRELHALVYREQPMCFLLHPRVTLLLGRHVQAAEPGPLGLSIERAFVRPEQQRR
jgi:ABC-type transport system substrate-binding protein